MSGSVSVCDMYVGMFMWVCTPRPAGALVCVYAWMWKPEEGVRSSGSWIYLIFWDRVCHWTQDLLICLNYLDNELQKSACHCPPSQNWDEDICIPLYHRAFMWVLKSWTQISMLLWHALYQLSHLPKLTLQFLCVCERLSLHTLSHHFSLTLLSPSPRLKVHSTSSLAKGLSQSTGVTLSLDEDRNTKVKSSWCGISVL